MDQCASQSSECCIFVSLCYSPSICAKSSFVFQITDQLFQYHLFRIILTAMPFMFPFRLYHLSIYRSIYLSIYLSSTYLSSIIIICQPIIYLPIWHCGVLTSYLISRIWSQNLQILDWTPMPSLHEAHAMLMFVLQSNEIHFMLLVIKIFCMSFGLYDIFKKQIPEIMCV